jgi:group II intron reverse transcriptase/maturase
LAINQLQGEGGQELLLEHLKGMRMQNANQILQAMQKLGEQCLPLTRVYRCLYNENLYLAAYHKLAKNQGILTPGTDEEDTADGMSLDRLDRLMEALRYERFRFKPARRTYVPKKTKGKRPLGLPNFSDKLVQEVMRMLLETYYEPRFYESSHGFRPGRGCHTALNHIHKNFRGTVWFIEGDIKGCFDTINHDSLMSILARDIQDGRLLNLIRMGLEAGIMENWQYQRTYSGTPQGGILSPLLANIYLHELDAFVEEELIPQYTRGEKRAYNSAYSQFSVQIAQARKQGDMETVHRLQQERRQLPSQDVYDPHYRRLHYVRYADDFMLGFVGPKSEAEAIKTAIGQFLRDRLQLEMSEGKTLITHARTEKARFLNYAISIHQADEKLSRDKQGSLKRRLNGGVRLGIPFGLVDEHCKRYMKNGKPVHEPALLFFSDTEIIDKYQQRFRGLAEYYKYAEDRAQLKKLKYTMQVALAKTLANKFRSTVPQMYRKYRGTQTVDGRPYQTLQVEVPTNHGSRIIYWGAIPLRVVKPGSEPISDCQPFERWQDVRSDLVQRLRADTCELCGAQTKCEVHHVRKLSDLKRRWAGRNEKPEWVRRMIALHRKTLIVCKPCHQAIHAGKPLPRECI